MLLSLGHDYAPQTAVHAPCDLFHFHCTEVEKCSERKILVLWESVERMPLTSLIKYVGFFFTV